MGGDKKNNRKQEQNNIPGLLAAGSTIIGNRVFTEQDAREAAEEVERALNDFPVVTDPRVLDQIQLLHRGISGQTQSGGVTAAPDSFEDEELSDFPVVTDPVALQYIQEREAHRVGNASQANTQGVPTSHLEPRNGERIAIQNLELTNRTNAPVGNQNNRPKETAGATVSPTPPPKTI